MKCYIFGGTIVQWDVGAIVQCKVVDRLGTILQPLLIKTLASNYLPNGLVIEKYNINQNNWQKIPFFLPKDH